MIDFDFDLMSLGRNHFTVHFICTLSMNVPGNSQFTLMPGRELLKDLLFRSLQLKTSILDELRKASGK